MWSVRFINSAHGMYDVQDRTFGLSVQVLGPRRGLQMGRQSTRAAAWSCWYLERCRTQAYIAEVRDKLAQRVALVPWMSEPPTGAAGLSAMLTYLDNQARESRLVTAARRKNVIALARMLGYKLHGARAATAEPLVLLGQRESPVGGRIVCKYTEVSRRRRAAGLSFGRGRACCKEGCEEVGLGLDKPHG
jgi:hypothetical protein